MKNNSTKKTTTKNVVWTVELVRAGFESALCYSELYDYLQVTF